MLMAVCPRLFQFPLCPSYFYYQAHHCSSGNGEDMSRTTRRMLLVVISISLIASIISPLIELGVSAEGTEPATLTPSATIRAYNDTELASLVTDNSWKGTGAMFDPYVIENLKINVTDNQYGIFLGNVSKYLIINNCQVSSDNVSWPSYSSFAGIALFNVTNSVVKNNSCSGNMYGIYLFNSSTSNIVTDNHCNGNGYGIYVEGFSCNFNVISKNNCSGNSIGIQLLATRLNTIIDNDFSGNDQGLFGGTGVELSFSADNIVGDNICGGKDYGIYLFSSSNNSILSNSCSGMEYGIYLEADSQNNRFVANTGTFFDKTGMNPSYDDQQAPYDVTPVFAISAVLFALVTAYVIMGRRKRTE